MHKHFKRTMLLLGIILIGSFLLSICIGRYSMNPIDVIDAIIARLGGVSKDPNMESIVFSIRLPRILAAMLVGAALSLSGAVYQGVFKNPLVSPDLLGVSSGACVGAALAIVYGVGYVGTQLCAFVGGLLAVLITVTIPKILKNTSNLMLVLSGVITGGFMSSLLSVLKYVASADTQLEEIVFWQMGSVASVDTAQIVAVSPIFIICVVTLLLLAWRINILSFGEDEAKTLGVNTKVVRGITIACSSLLTASCVSISGTIGWIGLVIPHLGRMLAGADNTKLLPTTLLLGAVFMLLIDTIARTATTLEIPLGVLTGLIGAPFYAWLLYKQKAKVQ